MPFRRLRTGARAKSIFRPTLEALESRLVPAPVVPAFSSLPGANHTIYLDFDGHVTTGKLWNSYFNKATINSPAFNVEGSADTFTANERTRIENIWKRVAEDFIPFNVNVTTVDPGVQPLRKADASDPRWGIRVVMTRDTEHSGAGGIAYLGSFNWDTDTPAFVYNNGEKSAAEAASHEVGHSLYLEHDGDNNDEYYLGHGSGDIGWAPIMGAGYYSTVTQWDRGEYFRANNNGTGANGGKGRDDLFVITNYNGFDYRDDDHGNEPAEATSLTIAGDALSGAGIIERTSDVDVFTFTTAGGDIALDIEPFRPGPNLDVKAELYDSLGNRVALSNPPALLEASINADLPAGTYYLHVDGTGVGNPGVNSPTGYTEYASLGRYTITGTSDGSLFDPNAGPAYLNLTSAVADQGEGNTGKIAFTFTVARSGNLTGAATVSYAVVGSGANPADATDFYGNALPSGTVTLAGGEMSKTLTIYVRGDSVPEPDEGFTLTISEPNENTELVLTTADGMIREDDTRATLQILAGDGSLPEASLASLTEGSDVVPTAFTFTVTRSGSVAGTATVKFQVKGVKPSAANKYDFADRRYPTGTIVFENGEASKQITILIGADSVIENNEDFSIVLKKPSKNASIVGGTLQVTIADDDAVENPDQAPAHAVLVPDIFPPPPEGWEDPLPFIDSEEVARRYRWWRRDWLSHADRIFADLQSWLQP